MDDIIMEFLGLFIAAGLGFVVGVTFMVLVTAIAIRRHETVVKILKSKINHLEEQLAHATGIRHQDEYPDMG